MSWRNTDRIYEGLGHIVLMLDICMLQSAYIKSRNVEDEERLFAKKSIHMISLVGILSILQMKKRKFFEKEESYQSLKHIKK